MMQRIFYIFDKTTGGLAYVQTDEGTQHLLDFGMVSPTDPLFIMDTDMMTEEDVYMSDFVNLIKFKQTTTPVSLEVHHEKATAYFLDELRKKRDKQLTILDRLQMRAAGRSMTALMQQMEADKEVLRNVITPNLFVGFKQITDFVRVSPGVINVDYEAKYETQLVGPQS